MTRKEMEEEIEELEAQKIAIDERITTLEFDIDSENYDPEPDEDE